MFGKNRRMNTLESRKQLLVLESELNRAQLVREVADLRMEVGTLTERARSLTSIFSSAAVLVSALAALRSSKSAESGVKRSWPRRLLKGAGLISTLWLALRSAGRDDKDK
jgi:hypothetical protein